MVGLVVEDEVEGEFVLMDEFPILCSWISKGILFELFT